MERNLHETTSRWKTYGKRLFFEDLEVRDVSFLYRINYSRQSPCNHPCNHPQDDVGPFELPKQLSLE
jgi:hypothetical protein